MVEPAPNDKNLNEEEGRSHGHRPRATVRFAPTPPKSPSPSTTSVPSDPISSVATSSRGPRAPPRAPRRPATGRPPPPPGAPAAGARSSRPLARAPPDADFKTPTEARSVSTDTNMLPVRPDGKSSRFNVKSNDATT